MADDVGYTGVFVGTDVGGTNTDCAIIAKNEVVSSHKTVTTPDITTGVKRAIASALIKAAEAINGHVVVKRVNIGTTHFVNAIIQRKNLATVSVIRVCGPATRSIPPFSDFPPDLDQAVHGSVHYVAGGCQVDGRDIASLNLAEVRQVCDIIHESGVRNIAVVGVFSTVNCHHETEVQKVIRDEYPDMSVTLSHAIGRSGLLERENAAIINECLKPIARTTIRGLKAALCDLGLTCPFYITQNDGTIISMESALEFPVRTLSSGPTNSMRGAAFLTKEQNAVVVDIGGTTTDVGMLVDGFPRLSYKHARVGGVCINYTMPDVFSFGLGGGSLVQTRPTWKNEKTSTSVSVGPESVGYKLRTESLVFGGSTVTATDVAVATGLADIGDKSKVTYLSEEFIVSAMETVRAMVEDGVDRIKLSKEAVPVILTGGGSILVDSQKLIPGTTRLYHPPHFDVANAVGAGLCKLSGSVDYTTSLAERVSIDKLEEASTKPNATYLKNLLLDAARQEAVTEAVEMAKQQAVASGAHRDSLQVLSKSDEPLHYMPNDVTRIRVKVVGDLAVTDDSEGILLSEIYNRLVSFLDQSSSDDVLSLSTANVKRQPLIDPASGEWWLTESDVESLALGTAVLGCGGGGNNYVGKLAVLRKLREGKRIRVMTPQRFYQTRDVDKDMTVSVFGLGAPTVLYEKIANGSEVPFAIDAMLDLYQSMLYDDIDGTFRNNGNHNVETKPEIAFIDEYRPGQSKILNDKSLSNSRRISAFMPIEVGGYNSMVPLISAADLDLPVLDADGMGRAFPQLEMATTFIYGVLPYPFIMAREDGHRHVVLRADCASILEKHIRTLCANLGSSLYGCMRPMDGREVMTKCVQHSLSRAWLIGEAIRTARAEHTCPVDAIFRVENGKVLITGKVEDVKRDTSGAFTRGYIVIAGTGGDTGRTVHIDIQNENLVATDVTHGNQLLACVPDLIVLIETDNGEPVLTEELCYGLRVSVLSLVCSPILTTPAALAYVGPAAFGYPDLVYNPVAEYRANDSVPPIK